MVTILKLMFTIWLDSFLSRSIVHWSGAVLTPTYSLTGCPVTIVIITMTTQNHRIEDLTSPDVVRHDPKCDCTISLYGYVRGAPIRNNSTIHIAGERQELYMVCNDCYGFIGCGDYTLQDVTVLDNPCPLPGQEKKRSLDDKEKMVYAPMSGVGGVLYDKVRLQYHVTMVTDCC